MPDNESNSSSIDVAVQDQMLNDPSERSTSKCAKAVSPWAKYTAEELMEDCPHKVALMVINPSLWGVPAPEDADEIHATTWVAKTIHDYHLFQKVERNTLKSLKTVMRHRGVYTGNIRARVADSMFNLLGGENSPEWDPAEFKATKFDERYKAYQRQQSAHQAAPVTTVRNKQVKQS
ncbi:hypothetical protein EK21DRAFT_105246 [Setomelanomma holmii]|uniref:Uncharacterized protein n=1 Tax=Setomelanomma holmii TaxID=210430 RepID=A0A9P4LFT6_9PLEO|nr:hypothetical protein EK21DRAFT_105246 [Setomelanomma holmii]